MRVRRLAVMSPEPRSTLAVPLISLAKRLTTHTAVPAELSGNGAPKKHSQLAWPEHVPIQSALVSQNVPFPHFFLKFGAVDVEQLPTFVGVTGVWQSAFVVQVKAELPEQRPAHVGKLQSVLLVHVLPLTPEPPTHAGHSLTADANGSSHTVRELFEQRQLSVDGSIPATSHWPQPGDGGPSQTRYARVATPSLMSELCALPVQPLSRSATVVQ